MLNIKKITELVNIYDAPFKQRLSDQDLEEKSLCESSFAYFLQKSWPIMEGGGSVYIHGWHMDAVCEHLEALQRLDISRLIINLPPRMGKSTICSVAYCAWIWTKQPSSKFLYSAYAQGLAVRDSVRCRRLVQSKWYQKLWGDKFHLMKDVNNKLRFENSESGHRIASSVGGANTGEGAHYEVCDDPNNVKKSDSEVTRVGTNDWHDFVMSSRHAGIASQFRRLVVQQRTHAMDVTGNILSKDDDRWIHLRLPMEYEKYNSCRTIILPSTQGVLWEDPRRKEGELLWEAGMNAQQLHLFKTKDFKGDSYRIAGQLQQRPSPSGGGILKEDWFKVWKERELPDFDYVLQSWDTALTSSATSCYSACTTWGVFKNREGINNIMLISVFRERIEYPELRKMATRLSNNYYDVYIDHPISGRCPPHLVLIEAKVSGYSLIADLMSANIPVMKFDPGKHGDKIARCRIVSHLMENGLVWLPTEGPSHEIYTEDSTLFIQAAMTFPNDESNDIIDSMSQAFIRLLSTGWATNKEDPLPVYETAWRNKDRPYS